MSPSKLIDVALFGEEVERSLHTALNFHNQMQKVERSYHRGSAGVHALDAQLQETLKRGWVTLHTHQKSGVGIRFCLTACGISFFKAWIWVFPIAQLFDGSEPQKKVLNQLRLMRSLAPEAQGLIWLTPSPRITQFELDRSSQKVREILKNIGINKQFHMILPNQGVAEIFRYLSQEKSSVNKINTLQIEQIDERGQRVMQMNHILSGKTRLSVTKTHIETEPLSLDELVPILEGEYEGVDQQVWRVQNPFYISQTLMTRALFNSLMQIGTDTPQFTVPNIHLPYLKALTKEINLREPISRVSWLSATFACNALSRRHGLPAYYRYEDPQRDLITVDHLLDNERFEQGGWAVYADLNASHSFRLPLYDEWCYAAAAREPYPYAGGENSEHLAWSAHNSGSKLHSVALLNSNRWGLYDMNGLLWEWCEDGPSQTQVEASERWASRPKMRLLCDSPTQSKWLLGGSWANHPWVFPIGERLAEFPTYADDFMGLRVVRSAKMSENTSASRSMNDGER